MADRRRVVVTGLGAITPIGLSVEEFWNALLDGKSGAANITKFDPSRLNTHFACEVKGFEPLDYLEKKEVRRLDLFAQYAIAAASQAIKDSGLEPDNMSDDEKNRVGVIFGSGIGGMSTFDEQAVINSTQGPSRISPFFIPMLIPDIASGQISIKYGFRGPNYCIVSACATANNNMIDSFMLIKQDLADIIISGGSEAPISELGVGGFNASRALSTRNGEPSLRRNSGWICHGGRWWLSCARRT